MIGKTLGHHQITEKLGEEGMGVVYKARDTHLDRFVGLKGLPAEKVADTDLKRHFVQGATAISALHHPNVIRACHALRSEGTDSTAREHYAFEAAAQPVDDQEPSLSELSWNRPHV
jgi:eukaryotic-like serine/threonine-protein kinase